MSEEAVGFLIFVSVAVAFSLLSHWIIRQFVVASILAGIASNIVFITLGNIHRGFADPFFPIACVVGSVYGAGVASVVGLPFLHRRNQNRGRLRHGFPVIDPRKRDESEKQLRD